MAVNEDDRQAVVAAGLEERARTLAHSTRRILRPVDSYAMLGELAATSEHLEQVCQQLAAWHQQVTDGVEYAGEDERGDGATGTVTATAALESAAAAMDAASQALRIAHTANGVVRWIGPTTEETR